MGVVVIEVSRIAIVIAVIVRSSHIDIAGCDDGGDRQDCDDLHAETLSGLLGLGEHGDKDGSHDVGVYLSQCLDFVPGVEECSTGCDGDDQRDENRSPTHDDGV